MRLYYYENSEKKGPITSTQLRQLARQGAVVPTTTIETEFGGKTTADKISMFASGLSLEKEFAAFRQSSADRSGAANASEPNADAEPKPAPQENAQAPAQYEWSSSVSARDFALNRRLGRSNAEPAAELDAVEKETASESASASGSPSASELDAVSIDLANGAFRSDAIDLSAPLDLTTTDVASYSPKPYVRNAADADFGSPKKRETAPEPKLDANEDLEQKRRKLQELDARLHELGAAPESPADALNGLELGLPDYSDELALKLRETPNSGASAKNAASSSARTTASSKPYASSNASARPAAKSSTNASAQSAKSASSSDAAPRAFASADDVNDVETLPREYYRNPDGTVKIVVHQQKKTITRIVSPDGSQKVFYDFPDGSRKTENLPATNSQDAADLCAQPKKDAEKAKNPAAKIGCIFWIIFVIFVLLSFL